MATGRKEEEKKSEGGRVPANDRGRRRRNELKAHTVAATSDLWWDYRWRYFFITVSPGCLLSLSFLFFISLRMPSFSPLQRSSLFWTGWLAPAGLAARSSFGFFPTLPISPCAGNVHAPAHAVQLAGGCILITFMSSDIPARFITPAPADSAKARNQPHLAPPPSSSRAPFLASLVLRFLRFSLLQDHPSSLGPRNQPCMVILPSL